MPDANPADTMRGRIDESRYKVWVLTRMNRWALAASISAVVFIATVLLSIVGPTPIRRVITDADALWWVFSPMITGTVTVVTLVVTFNQLVLSQELGALGDQRERMKKATEFRSDAGEFIDAKVAPPEPAAFLGALLDGIQTMSNTLASSVDSRSGDTAEWIESFVDELTANASSVGEMLDDAQFGTFEVVFAALHFNYSWKIYEAQRLIEDNPEALSTDTKDQLRSIIDALELFGPAREHFKTLYFQWELVNVSRAMLYASLPALVTALGMLLYVDTAGVTGTVGGIDSMVWLVAIAATITLFPFFVLLSFVLRIATVAKRTLAMGPFILRETERTGDLEWE